MTDQGNERSSAPRLRVDALTVPHPDRFAPDHPGYRLALSAHAEAVARGEDGYLDPASGLFVLTASYLLRRGWCCDRGCRHCPYAGAQEPTADPGGAAPRRGADRPER